VFKNSARIWPYSIGASIVFVFGACVATIVITSKSPVEKSDTYMMGYHEADAKANEIIKEKIDFDKKYKIEYITDQFEIKNAVIKYRVSDLSSNPVNNANVKVILTRPDNHKYDKELADPKVVDGVYTFDTQELAHDGRWDVMAKVSIDGSQRFYNIKTDTRSKEIVEY
jgi:nitrogen fixation protein FixH